MNSRKGGVSYLLALQSFPQLRVVLAGEVEVPGELDDHAHEARPPPDVSSERRACCTAPAARLMTQRLRHNEQNRPYFVHDWVRCCRGFHLKVGGTLVVPNAMGAGVLVDPWHRNVHVKQRWAHLCTHGMQKDQYRNLRTRAIL